MPATAEPAMTAVRDEPREGGEVRNDVTIGVTIWENIKENVNGQSEQNLTDERVDSMPEH